MAKWIVHREDGTYQSYFCKINKMIVNKWELGKSKEWVIIPSDDIYEGL